MKFAPVFASALAVACVATSGLTVAGAHQVYEEAGFAAVVGQEVKLTPALRRQLQTGSGVTDAPSTTTPATTTTTPTTTTPATTTATPTTTTPTTTTPVTTTATPTATTATPEATTATPETTTATPEATTATPSSTTVTPSSTTATPSSTTATPSTTTAASTATSAASSTSTDTTTTSTPSVTESATSSSSGSASSASADTSSGSSMSTGAVIGIVVGIIAAVAIIATIIMCAIRRRREADDDPLSPFELSMDKGYNPTPGGFSAQNSYNPRALGVGASASGSMSNTRTPPADAVAAGVAYSQFYDNAATSPGSMNRLESNVDSVQTDPGNNPNAATNGTNLWLSAMEPKDNDSYLSAHESPRSSRNSSRNSYEVSSNQNVDVDQSSQISGNSNKESDDFPDHHEDNDSARGSYEL
ncbi:hypothetical protein V7S43_005717 [Phytophthora oleae]|uniref:Mid2 domain-containing protein n=1 Tax=Phytophthora oleae TaxID=2107226 RepID=A0ABD3FUC5_9STRA